MVQPIDPVRMRIFSELNLQLAQHDISKDIMNETAKHLAFLSRYYFNDPHINPLIVSVPIVDVPVVSPGGGVTMAHKIALVVHETASSSAPASASASTSSRPRIRVLIRTIGTMGHRKCLVTNLCAIAERVFGGLLDGDEDMVGACEVSRKGKEREKKVGNKPVWDVVAWEDYC